jgi:hypothetical protein
MAVSALPIEQMIRESGRILACADSNLPTERRYDVGVRLVFWQ